jgi:AhpD family alkylhydroperoxidase
MENQLELVHEREKQRKQLTELMPEVSTALKGLTTEVYKDGVLSGKVKRLMALSIALGTGCRNCILGQTINALEKGATKEEILETISVVISMKGSSGVGESLRVIQLLEEMGKV